MLSENAEPKKRGMMHVLAALLGGALVMSPSYLADIMLNRLKLHIAEVAVISLVLFLVGIYLVVKLVKD
jgi:hypothetical protein